mgnify:CR=1 FL=1
MVQAHEAHSFWVDGNGQAVQASAGERPYGPSDRVDAMDRLGWIHVHAKPDQVELWVNPLAVRQPTLGTAAELAANLRSEAPGRALVVRVHDRESRGSLVADSVEQLPDLIREAVGLTSRPAYPLMQDRLAGCIPTEINDDHVHEMWRFRQTDELVERVVSTAGRAKLVSVQTGDGDVQYLAHDRWTAALWRQPAGFAGRYLDDLPMPAPLKRSVRADLTGMLRERGIVVSFVRGLRRIMPDDAPMDSYFRVSIPLRRTAGWPGRTAVVLLAPYN